MLLNIPVLSAFALYFTALAGVGLFFSRRAKNAAQFALGGRSVNYWVTAVATQASDMGAWLFMGLPGALYAGGMPNIWMVPGLIVGMFLAWHYVAPRLRTETAHHDSLTLPSYFATQFGDQGTTLQTAGALLSILFFIFYIASGLVGLGTLFEQSLGISYTTGIIVSTIATALYALLGGFIAIAWCDFFQGMFLLCVILLVPALAFQTLPNGIADIITAAQARSLSLSPFIGTYGTLQALLLAAGWGLGYFGQPHILMNFMGIDDPKSIPAAKRIGITWQILVLLAATAIGLIGIAFFPMPLANSEHVFIGMATVLLSPFTAGLALCGILAATLSTIDSIILASGTTITYDLLKTYMPHHFRKQETVLLATRVSAMGVLCAAIALSLHSSANVYDLVNYAWSGLGSCFGPLVLASLYGPPIGPRAALTGMLAGGAVAALWPFGLPLVPGFFANTFILFGARYLTGGTSR